MTKKVLLFTKQNSWCDIVGEYCKRNFDTTWVADYQGTTMDRKSDTTYDYIISYLSPWIIGKHTLERGDVCINFHPGSPKYPGIGGYNFALYHGDKTYGVVVHFMEEKVDTGKIIQQTQFPIFPNDTVETLKERSMLELLKLFYTIMDRVRNDAVLKGYIDWEREPYTRKDLQHLCHYALDFPDFTYWYNACYFPNAKDKPHTIIDDKKYYIIREDHYEKDNSLPGWQFSSKKHPWDTAYWESV